MSRYEQLVATVMSTRNVPGTKARMLHPAGPRYSTGAATSAGILAIVTLRQVHDQLLLQATLSRSFHLGGRDQADVIACRGQLVSFLRQARINSILLRTSQNMGGRSSTVLNFKIEAVLQSCEGVRVENIAATSVTAWAERSRAILPRFNVQPQLQRVFEYAYLASAIRLSGNIAQGHVARG